MYFNQLVRMGHEVKCVDENLDIVGECRTSELVILVGSHGRKDKGEFTKLRKLGVKSCTIHLDKFIGIPGRDPLNGRHWATDHQFTADYDIKLKSHSFMKPAIPEEFCHYGVSQPEMQCDVAFVGARDTYHEEYPWRRRLVDFLEARYGERFIWVGGDNKILGHDLNDFYASAKVIVGDWYGGGAHPYYTSDRLYETTGRGGLLLIPRTEGVNYPEDFTYDNFDLFDLQKRIEECLDPRNATNIRQWKAVLMEGTKELHTYRQRLTEVLAWANL